MEHEDLTLVLADQDVQDAKRLLGLLARAGERRRITNGARETDVNPRAAKDVDPCEKLALAMFAVRDARAELLPDGLSGQPAWDILLALYLADRAGVRHTMGRMIELSRSSLSTGLRYVDLIEAEGLAKREQDKRDGRIIYLRLCKRGRTVMNKILSAAVGG